jgi:hypothetical protein
MKKVMLILAVVMMAAPAMATITYTAHDDGGGKLRIAYTTDDPEFDKPRGTALEVTLGDGATVDPALQPVPPDVDPAFNCFIDYAWDLEKEGGSDPGGYVVGAGSPLAKPDTAGSLTGPVSKFVISMGVLDEGGDQNPGPVSSTNLITLNITQGTEGTCSVSIIGDTTRGPGSGVVGSTIPSNLYDEGTQTPTPVEVEMGFCDSCFDNCETSGLPLTLANRASLTKYDWWNYHGKPDCWCYPRQCYGDADGKVQGAAGPGFRWVYTNDLNIFSVAYGVKEPTKGDGIDTISGPLGDPGICSDFAHDVQGAAGPGFRFVYTNDLNIFSVYYGVKEPPKTQVGRTPPPSNCGGNLDPLNP